MIEMLELPFFRNALAGIFLISVMAALVGTYIVCRRMVFISGGITHACFGGLGLGYWLGVDPMLMAAVFAVGSSLGVDAISRNKRVRSDTAIAMIWAIGMALGVLFVFMSSGYVPDLNSFLFGNVLTITSGDLWLFLAYVVASSIYFYIYRHEIVAISFDEDFAITRHLPVRFINLCMTVIVSLGIVLMIRMIGIMLLMSMLSLPQMAAETASRSYFGIIWRSFVYALIGGTGGLFAAWWLDVPASATIVLALGIIYCVSRINSVLRLRRHRGAEG